MDERYFLRILLGTSLGAKSAEELSRTYQVPPGLCVAMLEFLERRGYVANVVTLSNPDGASVKYYARTALKLREMGEELSPETMRAQLSQSP